MHDKSACSLSEGFSVWEKLYAQFAFFAMGIIATVGIMLADWPWILPYVFIYWYGIPGIIMRHLVCPRCPHLHVYGDCLQAPPSITKWLMKERKTAPFSAFETFLFYAIFIAIPLYPIYWLLPNTALLIAFVLFTGMWYLGQFLHFCKRCRLKECPFNNAPEAASIT